MVLKGSILYSFHYLFFFFWVAAIWEVPGWWTGMVGYYKICKTGRNYQNEFYGLAWAVTVSKTNCLLVIPLICNIRGMVLFFIYTTPFNWQSISLSGLYECDIFLSYFDLAVSTNIYKVDCVYTYQMPRVRLFVKQTSEPDWGNEWTVLF